MRGWAATASERLNKAIEAIVALLMLLLVLDVWLGVIDRYYFNRGCYRYCKVTYLHERIDCYGRVVRCWRTCRTIRV